MSTSEGGLPNRFETQRLVLRPFAADDAAWYYQMSLRNREHLQRYESGNVTMSLTSEQHARRTLGELAGYWDDRTCYFLGVFDKETDVFVAQLYAGAFSQEPVDFIIGYFADCVHEGHGYVTEAATAMTANLFNYLGVDQVRIHCDESNSRSRRVAEQCGFHLESSFQENKRVPDGGYCTGTTVVFLRLRSDHDSS